MITDFGSLDNAGITCVTYIILLSVGCRTLASLKYNTTERISVTLVLQSPVNNLQFDQFCCEIAGNSKLSDRNEQFCIELHPTDRIMLSQLKASLQIVAAVARTCE